MWGVIKLGSVEAPCRAEMPHFNQFRQYWADVCYLPIMVYYEKSLTKLKEWVEWNWNHWPDALWVNYCFHLLHTPVNEWWVLYACKNKLNDLQRHSFHFEQGPFWLMHRMLSLEKLNWPSGLTSFASEGSAKFEKLEECPPEIVYCFATWVSLLTY